MAGLARLTAKCCFSVFIAALGDIFSLDLPAHVIGLLLLRFNDDDRVDLIKHDDAVFMKKTLSRFSSRPMAVASMIFFVFPLTEVVDMLKNYDLICFDYS